MQTSIERILTTHTGSLPRPAELDALLFEREEGGAVDPTVLSRRVAAASADIVATQLDAGLDVINDGELGKIGYSTYVKERLTGFGGTSEPVALYEMAEFPDVFRGNRQVVGVRV